MDHKFKLRIAFHASLVGEEMKDETTKVLPDDLVAVQADTC